MEVFRISEEQFSKKLTASGKSNRWNLAGEFVIYTGSSRALSTLELIVHESSIKPALNYRVMIIFIADEPDLFTEIRESSLPKDWRLPSNPKLQMIGSKWYNSQQSLVLKVPSAIITTEFNYAINTTHKFFKQKIKRVHAEDYFWDSRLIT